jgi:hypothetical protein
MRGTVMVDLRNIYDPAVMQAAGFAYQGVGRGARAAAAAGLASWS